MQRTAQWLLLGSISCLLLGCNYFNNVGVLTGGRVAEKDFNVTFPFHYERGLLIVDVLLGDDPNPHPFIFDTGAFDCKVEAELAGALGFPVKATKTNSDSQGNERIIEVVEMDQVTLGGLRFETIGAGKLEWDSLSASPCLADGGLIGANLIKLANWRIDYTTQTIQASSEPFEPAANAIRLKFTHPVFSGTPEIKLEIGGRTVGPILLDLGSNGSLRLPYALHDAFPDAEGLAIADQSSSGIHGIRADSVVVKPLPIRFGDQEYTLPITFKGSGDGLLGNEILEHFRIILNYKGNEAWLEPIASGPTPAPTLTFIPGVLNDSLWVVNRTVIGSDWALGDTVATVNGFRPADLYTTYCDFFLGIRDQLNQAGGIQITTLRGETTTIDPIREW